jgi:hypothetical protein
MTWLRAEWDRVAGFSLIGVGALLLVLGYHGVSRTPYVAEQLSYIVSGGVGGLFCLGLGATLLISADLHDEWRKLDRLEAAVRGEPAVRDEPDLTAAPPRPAENGGQRSTSRRLDTKPLPTSSVVMSSALAIPLRDYARRGYTAVGAGMLAAAVFYAVGWQRAASHADPKIALEGLVLGSAGLVIAAAASAAGTMWLKRMARLRQTRIMAPWTLAELARDVSEDLPATPRASDNGKVWVAKGLTRYHRAHCRALVGVSAKEIDRAKVPHALTPCRLCEAE